MTDWDLARDRARDEARLEAIERSERRRDQIEAREAEDEKDRDGGMHS